MKISFTRCSVSGKFKTILNIKENPDNNYYIGTNVDTFKKKST